MTSLQELVAILKRLRPTTSEGFEGLIAQLLERLTGCLFYPAHAGAQGGRDMSTGGYGGTWIAVEAKHFRSGARFDRRNLLGELTELPEEVDVWVVASTARIPDQVVTALRKEGCTRGIAVETLDAPLNELGGLHVLCAAHEDIVVRFLERHGAVADVKRVLSEIRTRAEYSQHLERLRNRFQASSIGYAQARRASLTHLRSVFHDSKRAKMGLGQPINVLENGGRHVVERSHVSEKLAAWWAKWPEERKPIVLLGEEGVGKTWALSSWLARRLGDAEPTLPLTLFVPSGAVNTKAADELVASTLASFAGDGDFQFWLKRIKAFTARSRPRSPVLLLVLDGLNERPDFDWRPLLESFQLDPLVGSVALAVTCRPLYWREELLLPDSSYKTVEVGQYNDQELADALEKNGLSLNEFADSLKPLMRTPRYLDLTVKHRAALEDSGDMTVDRLLYEDWKDRLSRKRGLFSDKDFRSFLSHLAKEHRNRLSKREVQNLLPIGDKCLASLDEIITGGILVPDMLGRYSVEPDRLIQGFGLLLAAKVREKSIEGELAMREAMASLLEPHADMDRKTSICRSAATVSILEDDFRDSARIVLFEQWLQSRNISKADIESFIAYVPVNPLLYLELVALFWRKRRTDSKAQRLLVRAFFRWRDNQGIAETVVAVCGEWLSNLHILGYRFMRNTGDQGCSDLRLKIEERAGKALWPGEKLSILGEELKVTDDDSMLWLTEPALLLASLFPVVPFISALKRWALSRSIMGLAYERPAVAFILRRGDQELWLALEASIAPLLEGPRVAQQAAWHLLWASGREEAAPVLAEFQGDLFPRSHYEESYAQDPCSPFWRREDCSMCAARLDLPDRLVALKLAPHALDPSLRLEFDIRPRLQRALAEISTDNLSSGHQTTVEDLDFRSMEPSIAAFAPHLLTELYRGLVRALPDRPKEARDARLWGLETLALLLERSKEQTPIREVWERICKSECWGEEVELAEVDLFAAILFHVSAKTQIDLLLQRPEEAFDAELFGQYFKRLAAEDIRGLAQGLFESSPHILQRKLWFISYQPIAPVLEVVRAERLVALLDHPDPVTSHIAQDWLFRSGSDEIVDLAIECGKVTPAMTQAVRQRWGRGFAVRMRSRLPYEMLSRAIDLGSLSYIVEKRHGDLEVYIRDLDAAVRNSENGRADALKTGFSTTTLRAIVRRSPEVVDSWVQLAVKQEDAWSPLLRSCHMMLESLCDVLFEAGPGRGGELFRALLDERRHARTTDYPTGVDVLMLTLFRVPWREDTKLALREWLDNCKTNGDIFEVALANSAICKDGRLSELIREDLSSSVPVRRAVALFLSGFSTSGSVSADLIDSVEFHPEGWLHEVRSSARWHLDRDRWAQEWFRRFATSKGLEESFAAFRLFLRCVDRRYWTWRGHVLGTVRLKANRRRYLNVNRREIERAIKENEKEFKKRFLLDQIPEGKVAPWL
jgi:hypothetical protein